ncbi:MAG TPA: lysylphosphatidylglycerol synthase transmembrane domain-containing protein [Anaerolineales bacterium]
MKLTPSTGEKAPGKEPRAVPSAPQRWGKGNWQLWIGVVFSLGFLVLALRNVDLTETANALRRVNVLILGAAVASYVFSAAAKAIRWQLLLAVHKAPSFGRAFSILSVGLMVNTFLPARLGEFARAYLMGEAEADSKVYVLGTVAVEKVADLLFLLLLLAALLLQMALPVWLAGPARGMALVLAILVPCFVLLAWQRDFILRMVERTSRFVPSAWREWLVRQMRYGLASLDVVRRPRLLIGLFGWSLIVWILSALTNTLVFMALELAMPVWASLLLLVVLQVGTAVPSSPGRIGVFQYLVILTLSIFAVDKNVALGYSVVLYLVIYAPIALLGVWGLWHEKITWGKLTEAVVRFSEGWKSG